METGQPVTEVLGAKADVVGNPGALMDAIKGAFDSSVHLNFFEGIKTGPQAGPRVGMAVSAAVGNPVEVAARSNSPLLNAISGDYEIIETLSSPAPRKTPPSGPGFGR